MSQAPRIAWRAELHDVEALERVRCAHAASSAPRPVGALERSGATGAPRSWLGQRRDGPAGLRHGERDDGGPGAAAAVREARTERQIDYNEQVLRHAAAHLFTTGTGTGTGTGAVAEPRERLESAASGLPPQERLEPAGARPARDSDATATGFAYADHGSGAVVEWGEGKPVPDAHATRTFIVRRGGAR